MPIGETGDFREGAEKVLPDDEEDEQKGDHEGKEKQGNGFGEDECPIGESDSRGERVGGLWVELEGSGGEDRSDELLGNDCHEEDAAEDSEGLVEELEEVDGEGAGVFEFVAERRAEGVVDVIGEGEVFGEGDTAEG